MRLFECTLRDGTYVVDFMIEPETFFDFSSDLVDIGFSDIEVGHGLGLGAYRTYSAGFTDEDLWKKMAPLTEKARFYSFFIPYVGKPEDFFMAREYGLYGLRFGVEPSFIHKYAKIIEEAKSAGYFIALNFMKSYTVTPDGFAELVKTYKDLVDVVYLVDSAGYLLPRELKEYVERVYQKVGMIPLGFHGHNNLGLAVASALELIDLGVEYIDTTLTGIGRSGGNVPTETMMAVLAKKFGLDKYPESRLLASLALASKFRKYILSKGKNLDARGEDILFGYAGFHSSFEGLLRRFAESKGMDFYKAVLDISRKEQVRLTEEVLEKLYGELKS